MNEEKLNELLGLMLNELGAAMVGVHVILGDQLGLYKALAANGGLTSVQLAERTGTAERYVREWLAGQAASGYVDYDAEAGTFHMSPEQAAVLADEESPVYMAGGYYGLESIYAKKPKLAEAFSRVRTHCLRIGNEINNKSTDSTEPHLCIYHLVYVGPIGFYSFYSRCGSSPPNGHRRRRRYPERSETRMERLLRSPTSES